MIVKCYNCGAISPDLEEWELVSKLKWSSACKRYIKGDDWKRGDTIDSIAERIGKNWYCPDCFVVSMDNAFNLPIRLIGRRN